MSASRKRRVAEIYNAHETGGIEAIERAFSVSRSTAIRYIRAAREADLIEKGTRRMSTSKRRGNGEGSKPSSARMGAGRSVSDTPSTGSGSGRR